MIRKALRMKILLYALTFAAFALLFSATASAQTAQTDSTAAVTDPAPSQTPAKVVAPVDSTAETGLGVTAGVSGIGTDDGGNAYVALQFQNMVMKLDSGGVVFPKITPRSKPAGGFTDS